jgi:hypothetical protein
VRAATRPTAYRAGVNTHTCNGRALMQLLETSPAGWGGGGAHVVITYSYLFPARCERMASCPPLCTIPPPQLYGAVCAGAPP